MVRMTTKLVRMVVRTDISMDIRMIRIVAEKVRIANKIIYI